MIDFYGEMRVGILYLSSQKKSFVLEESEIKNLPQYKNADDKYKEDFNNSVLGSFSKGSITANKAKVKALKSPYASSSTYNDGTQEIIHHNYYEPKTSEEIDALVA